MMDDKTRKMIEELAEGRTPGAVAHYVAKLIRCPIRAARALVYEALTRRIPFGKFTSDAELDRCVAVIRGIRERALRAAMTERELANFGR